MMDLSFLMTKYDLTEDDIAPHVLVNTDNGWRTAAKECAALKVMNENKVLSHFFGDCHYKWITNIDVQKSGIDMIVDDSINIDLKSLIGPAYTITDDDNPFWDGKYMPCIVIELYQNGVFTNTNNKKTDYVLYCVMDEIEEKFILVDYNEIKRISATEVYIKKHVWHESKNKSGIYIKVPISELHTAKILKLS